MTLPLLCLLLFPSFCFGFQVMAQSVVLKRIKNSQLNSQHSVINTNHDVNIKQWLKTSFRVRRMSGKVNVLIVESRRLTHTLCKLPIGANQQTCCFRLIGDLHVVQHFLVQQSRSTFGQLLTVNQLTERCELISGNRKSLQ